MKTIQGALLAAMMISTGAATAAPNAAADENAIHAVEKALCDAFRDGDAATIARLEDETYTLGDTHGGISTRADDIAEAKKGEIRYTEFRNHDTKIRLYGDAAIVTGITSLSGTADGKPFSLDARFTDTYVRRADGWKIAASQATRVVPKS